MGEMILQITHQGTREWRGWRLGGEIHFERLD